MAPFTPTRSTEGCEGERGDDESLCVGKERVQVGAKLAEKPVDQVKARLTIAGWWLVWC